MIEQTIYFILSIRSKDISFLEEEKVFKNVTYNFIVKLSSSV